MILDRLVKIFTSLRLTVVLLALGIILVFWGTLAQVHLGLYKAQDEFFRSLFVFWRPDGSDMRIPIFPGGYLIGGLLLINLFAAHLRYYQPGKKKYGIAMIHLGVVLLLLGQFATDLLSTESFMSIREGASSNYSESNARFELAVVDTSDAGSDKVVAIPGGLLMKREEISHADLPFTIRVKAFYPNSSLVATNTDGFEEAQAGNSAGVRIWWRKLPPETAMNRRDMPSAIVELAGPKAQPAAYLVSGFLGRSQPFNFGGRSYEMALRPERYYKPFSLHLIDFRFDRYPGTEIPKNFSSRVRVENPATGERRETLIRMNEPLRYGGETLYQADWDKRDEKGTVLQVVRNPGWLTPYFACVLVAIGLMVQFLTHLVGFAAKRRTA